MGKNINAKTMLIDYYQTIENLLIISKHEIDKKAKWRVMELIVSKAASMQSC